MQNMTTAAQLSDALAARYDDIVSYVQPILIRMSTAALNPFLHPETIRNGYFIPHCTLFPNS